MENRPKSRLPRAGRIALISGLVSLILGGGIFGFIKWEQSRNALDTPAGFAVSCEKDAGLEAAARGWFESLMERHRQPQIRESDRINGYEIKSIKALDEQAAQIDFTLTLNEPGTDAFSGWSLSYDGDAARGEWVVTFRISGGTKYTAERIQRPAGYELEQYNSSGKAEAEELERELSGELPYDKALYTYKIEDGICSVSYDGGSTWIGTPLPLDRLDYYLDGQFKTNELPEGSCVISPEKTVILYGGFETPLTCLYSDDMGKTWKTSEPDNNLVYCHIKFLSFTSKDTGYIVAGSDKTMSWEAQSVYKTSDGGATWTYTGAGPRQTLMSSAGFVAEDTGFISYPYMEGAESMLYRTKDGGVSWSPVLLDIEEELQPFFTEPKTPFRENSALVLLIGEGENSDYEAAAPMCLKYVSYDKGASWAYTGMTEEE